MFHRQRSNCVLYLLLDKGFSNDWLHSIRACVLVKPFSAVIYVCTISDRVRLEGLLTESDSLIETANSMTVVQKYRLICEYHEQQYLLCNLLFVRSETYLTKIELSNFTHALSINPNIGTISSLSNVGQVFGLFDGEKSLLPLHLINQLLLRIDEQVVETPFYNPSFVYWRFQALRDTLHKCTQGSDDICFATLTKKLGFIHVLLPTIYAHTASKLTRKTAHKIDKEPESKAFILRHPLMALKHQLADIVYPHDASNPVVPAPVHLHVMHSWGGGLHRWVCDYIDADIESSHYVLKSIGDWGSFGSRLSLYKHPEDEQAIKHWDLYLPIHATELAHLQYRQIVQDIIRSYGIDVILVSSLIGHSLDILDTDIKTSLVLHDYYPFCPAIYIYYDNICEFCPSERLKNCNENNPLNFLFKGLSSDHWVSIRAHYIELLRSRRTLLVAPSESVIRNYKSLIPEIADLNLVCVPHGLANQFDNTKKVQPHVDSRAKILVLGKLDTQKGLRIWKSIVTEVVGFADVVFLGCGDEGKCFIDKEGVTVELTYSHSNLSEKLQFYAPDMGVLLPNWPETFSYTLSELMVHAIPPVVSAHGAALDRVNDGENGFLIKPESKKVLKLLRQLVENRALLNNVRSILLQQEFRSTSSMVGDYHNHFRALGLPVFGNSYAMACLSETVSPITVPKEHFSINGNESFFVVMQQLEWRLLGMVEKAPLINAAIKKVFKLGIKIWIALPVRVAAWYVNRKT